jgi:ABC-type protease/lipase transport system fused ATPase/permease subunit
MHASPLQIMIILMAGVRKIIIRTYLTWLTHTSRKSRLEKRGFQKMSHLQRVVVDHLSKLAKAVQLQQTQERLFLPYILPNVDIPWLILFMVVILNLVVLLLFMNSFLDIVFTTVCFFTNLSMKRGETAPSKCVIICTKTAHINIQITTCYLQSL